MGVGHETVVRDDHMGRGGVGVGASEGTNGKEEGEMVRIEAGVEHVEEEKG